jgi:putative transposase
MPAGRSPTSHVILRSARKRSTTGGVSTAIDQGLESGLSSGERAELLAARRRIAQLEAELKIARRAAELLKDVKPPKVRYAAIKVMVAEKLPIQSACRILDVSESGFYAWRIRPPSERAIRHAWLTDLVTEIHDASRQTYGSIRVHAELTLARGIDVGRHQVELVMRRAGLRGVVGRRKRPRIERPDAIAVDLVDRSFTRAHRNQLWVTDITEHPTREGRLYCCVVLDVFSRRVVGWSIDSSPTASLVNSALGMAISSRSPTPGTLSTPIKAPSSPLGHSRTAPRLQDWCLRWVRSETAMTMR